MQDTKQLGRLNQKQRTRKDLLQAALRLLKQGHRPTLEEVAEEAMVSRATAYRYFPSVETLLLEAPLDLAIPDTEAVFAADPETDAVRRTQKVDTVLHDVTLANEAALRMLAIHTLTQGISALSGRDEEDVPRRQNRRTPMIEAALAPEWESFDPQALALLVPALSLIVGIEGVFLSKDVLRLDDRAARRVKHWMIETLIAGAKSKTP